MRPVAALAVLFALATPSLAQVPCGLAGVTVTATPDPAPLASSIDVTITNNSMQTINVFGCVYDNIYAGSTCDGPPLFLPICPAAIFPIAPGESMTTPWNSAPNPPGDYSLEVSYSDATFSNSFSCCVPVTITAPPGTCALPGVIVTATPDPAPLGTPIDVTITNNSPETINVIGCGEL